MKKVWQYFIIMQKRWMVKYIECCNFLTINAKYIIVLYFWKGNESINPFLASNFTKNVNLLRKLKKKKTFLTQNFSDSLTKTVFGVPLISKHTPQQWSWFRIDRSFIFIIINIICLHFFYTFMIIMIIYFFGGKILVGQVRPVRALATRLSIV